MHQARTEILRWRRNATVLLLTVLIVNSSLPTIAKAISPDSPDVKAMVTRGYKYLETASYSTPGYTILAAMCMVKDGKDERHPLVAEGLKHCKEAYAKRSFVEGGEESMYFASVACIFMCELDPVKYRNEISAFLKYILDHQKPHGGFGYVHLPTGDTSQVQYVALALWTAQHAGFNFSKDAGERLLGWLLRTQDTAGGFSYQGLDPGQVTRTAQSPITPSLSAAGTSSIFVLSNVLGYSFHNPNSKSNSKKSELPPALRLVNKNQDDVKKSRQNRVPNDLIQRAMTDGSRVCDQAALGAKGAELSWHHYFMYAYERYQGFRELAEGKEDSGESRWYNEGFQFLKASQQPDGSWQGTSGGPGDTCFAILFLIRSTKKAIAKAIAGEGVLVGGRGFRGNMANAKLKDGKVIGAVQKGPVDEMISVLEDPQNLDIESLAESPEFIELSTDRKQLAIQVARLRRLVSAEKYEVRLVAVKTLGRTGDFDNADILIYALTDPDYRVVRAANDGLRNISRKFDALMPERTEKDAREKDRQVAVQMWKQWYKSVKPGAVFIE